MAKKKDRRIWTTEEHLDFLRPLVPTFIQHQAANNLPKFWSNMFCAFLQNWSISTMMTHLGAIRLLPPLIHGPGGSVLVPSTEEGANDGGKPVTPLEYVKGVSCLTCLVRDRSAD